MPGGGCVVTGGVGGLVRSAVDKAITTMSLRILYHHADEYKGLETASKSHNGGWSLDIRFKQALSQQYNKELC